MEKLVSIGGKIEGEKVEGTSRHPIKNRGMVQVNGKRCHRFMADMNIRAQIAEELPVGMLDDERLDSDAVTKKDAEIICDKAIIHSLTAKYASDVKKGSATHKTNLWTFRKQTLVTVDRSHEGIGSALAKRALLANPDSGFVAAV